MGKQPVPVAAPAYEAPVPAPAYVAPAPAPAPSYEAPAPAQYRPTAATKELSPSPTNPNPHTFFHDAQAGAVHDTEWPTVYYNTFQGNQATLILGGLNYPDSISYQLLSEMCKAMTLSSL